MDDLFQDIKIRIPANKFYPLRSDSGRHLQRKNLLEKLDKQNCTTAKGIQIIARAGQGKTTFASQFLAYHELRYAWYQIGEEDSDPILFITSLLSCLMQALPGFRAPVLEKMLANGAISPLDFRHAGNVLLHDLAPHLPDIFYLVLDDLHLLEGSEATNRFLAYLLDTSPPGLRFLLSSRRPLNIKAKVLKHKGILLLLDNEALALSAAETFDLFNDSFGIGVSRSHCQRIQRATDGWITGLVLAADGLATQDISGNGENSTGEAPSSIDFSDEGFADYFRSEVFNHLSAELYSVLVKLSLLDEIPLFLAEKITGRTDIKDKLSELAKRNFFVRRHSPDNTLFSLHHLFGMVLRQKAHEAMAPETITAIYHQAATHCLKEKRFVTALRYFLHAGDYFSMDCIVREEGMALLAINQSVSLLTVLQQVPPAVLQHYGWLPLFLGMAYYDIAPEKSAELLDTAHAIFTRHNDEYGELQATSQLIYYSWVHSGQLRKGARVLPRAAALFQKFSDELPLVAKILTARNLAAGFSYFNTDFRAAQRYVALAAELVEKHRVTGLAASIVAVRGYNNLLQVIRHLSTPDLEEAERFIRDPHSGTINRLGLQVLQIDDLQLYGDFEQYQYRESQLIAQVGSDLIFQTIIGPYLYIWRIGILIAHGHFSKALELLRASLHSGCTLRSPHLLSQFRQWEAFILAFLKDKRGALRAIAHSLALCEEAGGPFFFVLNKIVIGAAYAQLQQSAEAERLLSEGIDESIALNLPYFTACGYLQRAHLFLTSNQLGAAHADLRQGLGCMKKHSYAYFYSWTPVVMGRLLSEAVKENIEVEYARMLAAQRLNLALLDDGEVIPLLQIRVLGELEISLNEQVIVKGDDFSPAHRHLLALLITAAGQRISQEKIQLFFWPESAPDKARSNLDTLVSRLRSTLAKAMAPHSVKHYLSLQQGILRLENCRIDALAFTAKAEQGLEHARRGEWWRAGNAFHVALRWWRGCLPQDIFRADEVRDYCAELTGLLVKLTRQWAGQLLQSDRLEEAITILADTLKYDPTNDELVKMLYQAYLSRHDLTRAHKVLRRYEEVLRREEYSPREIATIIGQINGE